jgi:hypothetical protein
MPGCLVPGRLDYAGEIDRCLIANLSRFFREAKEKPLNSKIKN